MQKGAVALAAPGAVRAGERGVAAEIHFHGRREPAQRESVVAWKKKRRLREIHLRGDVLHPLRFAFAIEKTDRCRISAERSVRKCVDLEKLQNPGTFPAFPYSTRVIKKPMTMMASA